MLLNFWTKWRAKRALLHKYEFEAALTDWNAALSLDRAEEKRKLIARFSTDANTIEQNIAKEEAEPEYQNLAGQEKYEADREKNEAKKVVADYRAQAKALPAEIENHEATAKLLQASRRKPRDSGTIAQTLMFDVPPRIL
jgi:hypothetical protein